MHVADVKGSQGKRSLGFTQRVDRPKRVGPYQFLLMLCGQSMIDSMGNAESDQKTGIEEYSIH
jgi:hypothetical protein